LRLFICCIGLIKGLNNISSKILLISGNLYTNLMPKAIITALFLLISISVFSQIKDDLNGNFKKVGKDYIPDGWHLGGIKGQAPSYSISVDSAIKHNGKYL
jgi:hypothetical protein